MAGMSQREAAKAWHLSRATIQRAIRAGKLSLTPEKLIDPAEMLRAFGEPGRPPNRPDGPPKTTSEPPTQEVEIARLRAELEAARAVIEAKDAHLADLRAEVQRLAHERPTGPARKWWPWGR